MLCFGVVCLAFDVDDDPEHESCGSGGTVRTMQGPFWLWFDPWVTCRAAE